jgi:transcriptional regulator with XRE-family HTH domain
MVDHALKVKIIFGLKIRQIRLERGLSLNEVAQKVGFSVSYLNEIEKGKKYPKSEKIMALATAFSIDYDELISLKLVNDLEPIADILNTSILSDLPLEMFGIDANDFVDLMSKSPAKISAFINTLKEISRNYDIQNEEFFEAVLRSYQEMNENYFPDIEAVAEGFREEHQISKINLIEEFFLKKVLFEKYSYTISNFNEANNPDLIEIDLIYQNINTIILNEGLTEKERIFLFAKEIGFQVLGLKVRPNTSPKIKVDSFEAIFNDFKASYFAGALLINKDILIGRLTYFLASPKWDSESFLGMMKLFSVTPKTFINRVTNLLSGHFGLNNLFLLGIQHNKETNKFNTVNEMHLRQLHSPHGYARNEHYCRRWLGLSIINELGDKPVICNSQISEFSDSNRQYFVIAVAYKARSTQKQSDTIGFVIDYKLKSVIAFVNDNKIKKRVVNQTCERCNILDCEERAAAPNVYNSKMKKKNILKAVSQFDLQKN